MAGLFPVGLVALVILADIAAGWIHRTTSVDR